MTYVPPPHERPGRTDAGPAAAAVPHVRPPAGTEATAPLVPGATAHAVPHVEPHAVPHVRPPAGPAAGPPVATPPRPPVGTFATLFVNRTVLSGFRS